MGLKGRVEAPLSQPLVSVVTPFFNSAPYLAQCIESVLAQSHSRFEYILSDNCSTDGSTEIAETYASRDPRIRLIRQPNFLSQVRHYNSALAEISGASEYCKMVQADDFIFPDCLRLMVQAFEQSDSIGLVSSYDLKGNTVRGSGFPYRTPWLSGQETARLYLRSGVYVFGSPTTVMYRSSIVRDEQPFFDESLLPEDVEKCMQILERWDFGFVHQVLSFLRLGNESITWGVRTLQPGMLDRYIVVQRYSPVFLEPGEAAFMRKGSKQTYYRVLAQEALRLREDAFWKFHQRGLKTLGETIDWPYLALQIGRELLWIAANPGTFAPQVIRHWKRKLSHRAGRSEALVAKNTTHGSA
jgi:glycosyltransferase involved in cell wall biosynthesis